MSERKLAIIVLSIGERAFRTVTLNSIGAYAKKLGASLIVENEISLDFKTRILCKAGRFKRKNIECYLQKIVSIYDALETYDRVLLLDDSCLVRDDTPDIFSIVPENYLAAYSESEQPEFQAFVYDKKFLKKKRGISIEKYYNTGVLVVDRNHRDLFSKKSVIRHLDLFKSRYPDQAFFNFMIAKNEYIFALDERWNYMPIIDYTNKSYRQISTLPEDYLASLGRQYIVHVTGYYEKRESIITQVGDFFTHGIGKVSEQNI